MDFIQALRNFWEKYPSRKIYTQRCIDFYTQHTWDRKIFKRDFFEDGHFTAWVLVMNPEKTKFLLMRSKKTWTWQQFWGHADGEKNLREAAKREFEEESGIDMKYLILSADIWSVDVHFVPAFHHPKHWPEPEHYHYDINYFGTVSEDIVLKTDDADVDDMRWFSVVELQSGVLNLSSGMQVMFDEYFSTQLVW